MNWKAWLVGAVVFYVVTFALSFITGTVIHNGILLDDYRAHSEFWLPALNEDPPDMAALMPHWIMTGLIASLIYACLYLWIRPALRGPGWRRGLYYGGGLASVVCAILLSWTGVFNLPASLWIWWGIDTFLLYLAGGAAMGAVIARLAPDPV